MKTQYFDANHGTAATCGWICYRDSGQRDRMMRAEFGDDVAVSDLPPGSSLAVM